MRIVDWSSDVCSSDLAGVDVGGPGRLVEGPARRGDGGLGVLDAGLGRVLDQLTRGRVVRGVGLPWIDQLAIDEQALHGSSPCDRAGRGPGTPDNRRPCARNYRMRTTLSCDATHALPRQTQRSEEHTSELQSQMRTSSA